MGTAPVPDSGLSSHLLFLTSGHSDAQHSDAEGWASECPDVKNYKWRLNPVWHRSCTHMATVGVEGLIRKRAVCWRYVVSEHDLGVSLDHHWMTFNDLCHVCDVDYDHIAKVETMTFDVERLLPTLLPRITGLSNHPTDAASRPRSILPVPNLNSGNGTFIVANTAWLCAICRRGTTAKFRLNHSLLS